MMPHKNGFQVIEELKDIEETKSVPVILVTARGQTEDKVRGWIRGLTITLRNRLTYAR